MDRHYDFGDVEGAFARADRIVRRRLAWSRHAGVRARHVRVRGRLGRRPRRGHLLEQPPELCLPADSGSDARGAAASHPRDPVDIGGSFGAKFWQPRPMVVCALLSRMTGRPVKLRRGPRRAPRGRRQPRRSSGRTRVSSRSTPTVGCLRCASATSRTTAPRSCSARSGSPSRWPPRSARTRCRRSGIDFTGVLTNKTAQAAYRGLGGAALNFLLERITDQAADELGRLTCGATAAQPHSGQFVPVPDADRESLRLGRLPDRSGARTRGAQVDAWRERQATARGRRAGDRDRPRHVPGTQRPGCRRALGAVRPEGRTLDDGG